MRFPGVAPRPYASGSGHPEFQGLRVLGHIVRQKFQGDESAENGVLILVDHSHPATTQPFNDAIVRDCLPDHWRESYVDETGQVNESQEVRRYL